MNQPRRTATMWVVCLGSASVASMAVAPSKTQPRPAPAAIRPAQDVMPDPAATASDRAFEERLAALDTAMGRVADFRANFEQRKYTPLLKKPLESRGILTSRGRLVRWETTQPRHLIVVIEPAPEAQPRGAAGEDAPNTPATPFQPTRAAAPGEIRVYYPAEGLCEVYPIDGALSDLAGAPLPRLADLRTRFSLMPIPASELGGPVGNPAFIGLLLLPATDQVRTHLESIKVLIDETIPAATKVVVSDGDGERTEIVLTAIRTNTGLTEADVRLSLPTDVRLSRPLGVGQPR
ncbi:MAG: LolA family protein [Phycisphaerales bacterium]